MMHPPSYIRVFQICFFSNFFKLLNFYSNLGEHMMMYNDASPLLTVFGAFAKRHHSFITSLSSLCKTWTIYGSIFSLDRAEQKTHFNSSFEDDLMWFAFCHPFFSWLVFSRSVFVFYPDWRDGSQAVTWNLNLWGLQP